MLKIRLLIASMVVSSYAQGQFFSSFFTKKPKVWRYTWEVEIIGEPKRTLGKDDFEFKVGKWDCKIDNGYPHKPPESGEHRTIRCRAYLEDLSFLYSLECGDFDSNNQNSTTLGLESGGIGRAVTLSCIRE